MGRYVVLRAEGGLVGHGCAQYRVTCRHAVLDRRERFGRPQVSSLHSSVCLRGRAQEREEGGKTDEVNGLQLTLGRWQAS